MVMVKCKSGKLPWHHNFDNFFGQGQSQGGQVDLAGHGGQGGQEG